MEKLITKIKVDTLPNGYSLDINKRHFMYFSEENLAAGIFYHLLLHLNDEVDVDFAENLMEAAATWPTISESITANAKLMIDKKDAERGERIARKQLDNLQKKYDALKWEYDMLKAKYAHETTRDDNLRALLKKKNKK